MREETLVDAPEGHAFTKSAALSGYCLEDLSLGTGKTLCGRRIYPKKWRRKFAVPPQARCGKCLEVLQ